MNKRIVTGLVALLGVILTLPAKNALNYYANKAKEALEWGHYEDALDYARQEIADYGDNPNGYLQASVSLYALNQPGAALTMVNKAIELAKKDKSQSARCYDIKAQILRETGDTEQAEQALEKAMKLAPKDVEILLEHAFSIMETDPKKAKKELDRVKKLAPDDHRGFTFTAYILKEQGEYEAALEEISKAIALDDNPSYPHGLKGEILYELGRSPEWIRESLRSIELGGDTYGYGHENIVKAVENASTPGEQQEILNAIIEEIEKIRTPENGFYQLEGDLLYSWDDKERAADVYEKIIDMGKGDGNTFASLAACQREGNLFKAYSTVSRGLDLYPDNLALRYLKVKVGTEVGKSADVLPLINSLISEAPEADDLYVEKGKALMCLGRYAEAVEPFATAVMLMPSARNKMYYGDALRLSGNGVKAASEYNDILAKSDDEIAAEGPDPFYMRAMAFSGLGREAEAVKTIGGWDYESKLTFTPTIYARTGNNPEALKALKELSDAGGWAPLVDLYSFNFHGLQTESEFRALFSQAGINTAFNPTTGLLQYEVEVFTPSSAGTSLDEVQEALDNSSANNWVETINALCPIDMGLLGTVQSVSLDEPSRSVIFHYNVNPGMLDFDELNSNPGYKAKKEDVMGLAITDIESLIRYDVSLVYDLRASDNSGKRTKLTFSPSKLKELQKKSLSQDEIDRMSLDLWLEEEKLALNKRQSEMSDVFLDGKTLIYIEELPEQDEQFAFFELFNSEIKKELASMFHDFTFQARLVVFVRQGISLKYVFRGDRTGRTVEFLYTPEELEGYIEK